MSETQLASMFIGSADDGDDIDRGRPSDVGNMIHIVNPQTSEILDYITLDNIIDDTHKKSLESYIETYDAIVLGGDGFSYDKHLEKRNHIIIPDEDGTYQEFILFEVDKYRDTEGRKTHFYAHATYLELKKAKVIYPTRREGFTLSQHAGWALNDTGWTVGIVEAEGTRTFNIENHTNPYEFLKRIAREFEVELRFRVEHDGRRITARYVDFLERIGDWKGREVEFGRDLDSIRRIEKQDIVTALLGLGPEKEDGTRLEVLVEDEEALQRWGRVDEHGNLHHLIEPYEIQSERTEMTEEEARRYTRTALDKRINTQVTYETTILDLEEVPGLENKKIRFGDTIRIKDTYFNPPLYLEARVFEIERSIKNKAKKDIKLGDYIEYTEEEVHAIWRQLRNQIRRRITAAQLVEYAEPKKVESSTPPPINSEGDNPIWVDTSQEPYIPYVADVENNEWVRMTLSDDDVLVNEVNYNGLKWSKDEGLIVERSDGKVRSILNGTDGIKVQQKDVNDNWVDVFFVDSQGNVKFAGHLEGASGTFSGDIEGATITGSTFYAIDPDEEEHPDGIMISYSTFWKKYNNKTKKTTTETSIGDLFSISSYDYSGFYGPGTHLVGIVDLDHHGLWLFHRDFGDTEYGVNSITFEGKLPSDEFTFFMNKARFTGSVEIGSLSTPLWTGTAYPLDTATIYPSKRLTDCMTGWVLRFQRYIPGDGPQDNNFHYVHIPKTHALFKEGAGIRITLGEDTDQTVTKYIYVYNDRIVGHASNNQNRSQNRVLTGVFEY